MHTVQLLRQLAFCSDDFDILSFMNPSKTRRGIDDPPFDDEVVLHPSCDASLSSRIQIHVEAEQLAAVKPSARWCSLRLEDDPFQLRPPVVHRCSNFKSRLPHQIVSKEPESLLNSNTTSTLEGGFIDLYRYFTFQISTTTIVYYGIVASEASLLVSGRA